jgi:hypothetical protein
VVLSLTTLTSAGDLYRFSGSDSVIAHPFGLGTNLSHAFDQHPCHTSDVGDCAAGRQAFAAPIMPPLAGRKVVIDRTW